MSNPNLPDPSRNTAKLGSRIPAQWPPVPTEQVVTEVPAVPMPEVGLEAVAAAHSIAGSVGEIATTGSTDFDRVATNALLHMRATAIRRGQGK